jgi:N-acyl-D-amino-acid deacylase
MTYDLIIKNGTVFDGSGNPGFKSNIYINDGKIERISRLNLGNADEKIDATDLVVSPGFIDIHQHSDYTIFGVPKCDSYIHQGVTTVTVGHCGLTLAPISDEYKEDIKRYNDAFTIDFDIPYNWRSFGEYLEAVKKIQPGINLWPQIGHCTLRAAVMGYEARQATKKEIGIMKELLDQSMKEGARALSVGWYAPAYWADSDEIIELAKVANKYEGILTIHLRHPPSGVAEAFKIREVGVDEAFDIGEKTGIPVEIAHYDGTGIEEARAKGIDVTYSSYPYLAGSSLLGQVLPYWTYDGGVDPMLEKITKSKIREKIKEEVKKKVTTGFDWDKAVISYLSNKKNKQYEGKSIGEISRLENIDPVDFVCNTLQDENGNGMYIYKNGRKMCYVFNNLKNSYNYVMSDGWGLAPYEPVKRGLPHPRAYGAFPRVLGRYVRECGTIPLREAIRKMTWGPAQKIRLEDRGLLREKLWADITVFDPKTVMDKATFHNPHQFPIGIEHVILNGQTIIKNGEHTEVRAGKIL